MGIKRADYLLKNVNNKIMNEIKLSR